MPQDELLRRLYAISPPAAPEERQPPDHLLYALTPANSRVTVIGIRPPLELAKLAGRLWQALQTHGPHAHYLYLVTPATGAVTTIGLQRQAPPAALAAVLAAALRRQAPVTRTSA